MRPARHRPTRPTRAPARPRAGSPAAIRLGSALLWVGTAVLGLGSVPLWLGGAPLAAQDREPDEPAAAWAAQEAEWFPDTTAFQPLLAAPLETGLRGSLFLADRSGLDDGTAPALRLDPPFVTGDFQGRNVEAEVALGHRLPLVLARREDARGPSVTVELEVGTFSRFFMANPERDLINIDYRVGVPVSLGWRRWEGRIELRHVSSHLGDDFGRRFGIGDRQVSMEGLELLLARRVGGGFRGYVGAEANIHANPDVERTAVRAGVEVDPGPRRPETRRWPYAAVDLRMNSTADRLEGTAVAGLAWRLGGARVRLEGRGRFGPSSMGWLRAADETYWGLGLRLEP